MGGRDGHEPLLSSFLFKLRKSITDSEDYVSRQKVLARVSNGLGFVTIAGGVSVLMLTTNARTADVVT